MCSSVSISTDFQLKRLLYSRGRFDNPEYSASVVSRYVGFAIINFLTAAFKAVIMVRLFEMYDMSETIKDDTTLAKLRSKLLYADDDYSESPPRSKEATTFNISVKISPIRRGV
ncbi:uncharacterized protein LOC119383356 isoform X1 [Rhipicephalus sanguineus]|uniref:uncharacterized protein LOC119383356 isoform X1 n=1 Tax=Rhipicephalus sanguineus TaxID=34632 RepID=UPI0020C2EACE|nr:uncharacterized protein LOC119383356 isoform X1 [Rhipicephalus sanguineus]